MKCRELHMIKRDDGLGYTRIRGEAIARIGPRTLYHDPDTGEMHATTRGHESAPGHQVHHWRHYATAVRDAPGQDIRTALKDLLEGNRGNRMNARRRNHDVLEPIADKLARAWKRHADATEVTDAVQARALRTAARIVKHEIHEPEIVGQVQMHLLPVGTLGTPTPCPGIYALTAAWDNPFVLERLEKTTQVDSETKARGLMIAIESGASQSTEYIAQCISEDLLHTGCTTLATGRHRTYAETLARQTVPDPVIARCLARHGVDVEEGFARVGRSPAPSVVTAIEKGSREIGQASDKHWTGDEIQVDPELSRGLLREAMIEIEQGLMQPDVAVMKDGLRKLGEILAVNEGAGPSEADTLAQIGQMLQTSVHEQWCEHQIDGTDQSALVEPAALAEVMIKGGQAEGIIEIGDYAEALARAARQRIERGELQADRATRERLNTFADGPARKRMRLLRNVVGIDQLADKWRNSPSPDWTIDGVPVDDTIKGVMEQTRRWCEREAETGNTKIAQVLQKQAGGLREQRMEALANALGDECAEQARRCRHEIDTVSDPLTTSLAGALAGVREGMHWQQRAERWSEGAEMIREVLGERTEILKHAKNTARSGEEPMLHDVAEARQEPRERVERTLGAALAREFGQPGGLAARPKIETMEYLDERLASEHELRETELAREAEAAFGPCTTPSPAGQWAGTAAHEATRESHRTAPKGRTTER